MLRIGFSGKSREENEYRVPVHPGQFDWIPGDVPGVSGSRRARSQTVSRAIEIRDSGVRDPAILRHRKRGEEDPHPALVD